MYCYVLYEIMKMVILNKLVDISDLYTLKYNLTLSVSIPLCSVNVFSLLIYSQHNK
jgi:hypothetical protein